MRRRRASGAAIAAGLMLASCHGAAGRGQGADQAGGAAPAAATSEAATSAIAARGAEERVTLTVEARRQAGIATEIVHRAPFALTLTLQARLSPVAETPEELEARLAYRAAETRDRLAAQELERVRKLAADAVVASKTLQAAEADAAEAHLGRVRAETALRNLGLDAAHEPPAPTADIWALADLYGPQAAEVMAGAAAWIRVDSLADEVFPARVVSLARFLKPETRTLTVRIAVQDPRHRLRPQDIAAAEVQVAGKTAFSVPDTALLYQGNERILFIARGGGFEKRRVQAGAQQAGRTEILAGLADGDDVVTRGAQFLLGEIYKVRNPGAAGED